MHAAAASQKCVEENGITKPARRSYASDLASSGLYLFGDVKHCMKGPSFERSDEFLSGLEEAFRDIHT
jgi:hypothetical protein